MRVAVCPGDDHTCGPVRLILPAEELQRQGHDIVIRDHIPNCLWERGDDRDRVVDVLEPDFDLLVLQRVYRPQVLEMMQAVQRQGIPVAIDLDDDLLAVHPDSPAFRTLEPFWDVLREALRSADLLTVSTPALAKRYGGHGRVVPNGIPRAYLGVPTHPSRQVPVVGWTGTVETHIGALEQTGSAIADLCRAGKATFRAIGDPAALDILGVGEWVPGAPMQDLSYARLYSDLDIAIVPLKPNRFSAAKSWMKGLEAAALGVPFVASPTPEYVRLHELGAGLLAETPKEWKAQLTRLLDSDLRAELSAAGRRVASTLTTESFQAPKLWEAWVSVLSSPSPRAALSASSAL